MTLFRYPGGKNKLKIPIIAKLKQSPYKTQYIEPCWGSGSVGLELTKCFDYFWINDIDYNLMELWRLIVYNKEYLKSLINNFIPSVDSFFGFKQSLQNPGCHNAGFKKLAIHQMSYSGLGVKAGGPIGGKSQKSNYKINCRWSPTYLNKQIDKIALLLNSKNVTFTSWDFEKVINNILEPSTIYIDPPYYIKGNSLYQYGFSIEDHKRLKDLLKSTCHYWVLSYDDCPEILELYNWANIEKISINYTINTCRQRTELLISKPI